MNIPAFKQMLEQSGDKLAVLDNDEVLKEYEFDADRFIYLIGVFLSESEIVQLLHNKNFIEKYNIDAITLNGIISGLSDETITEVLLDSDLITNKLHLQPSQITSLIKQLLDDDAKDNIINLYQFDNHDKVGIYKTYSNERKLEIMLGDNNFNRIDILNILHSLDAKTLSHILSEHKELFSKNDIRPFEITRKFNVAQQINFLTNLENFELSLDEKREILVTLKDETKQSIDTSNFPEEYKKALSIKTNNLTGIIIVDLERNLEDYHGLDNLMGINPESFTEEQKAKFIKLCDICPNMKVLNTIDESSTYTSTASEYKEAEEWIQSIIDNLDPEYSDAQKLAVIDNAIGKKISYVPDFNTEAFNNTDCRALWKIISSGYGICNGIANVEKYILNRVGIESELISSDTHTFLKIKNIELPLASGEVVKGNTILDPTWNLAAQRFGGKPNNFCMSYEEARKHDVDIENKDHKCHKNDEELQDATLNLDEQSLRQLFTSVGLADKNGQFPIEDLKEKSKQIHERYSDNPEQNINEQFSLLRQTCPEFATCQNSSIRILSDILLDDENLSFNKCVVNRVYDREDEKKRPVMYVYISSDELGEKFYFADKNEGHLVALPQEEFTRRFECYEADLEKYEGIRPWEAKEQLKEDIDLSRSSGKVVAEEGVEL